MEEVADHQALDLLELGKNRGQHAGLMHARARPVGACGSASNWLSTGHSGCGVGEVVAQARKARFDALLGLRREADAVARHEFKQAEREFGLHVQSLRRAEMDALPVHAELGIGDARTEIAQLRKQGTGLALAGFQGADGGAVDGARMAVVFAHPLRGVGKLPVLGQRILRVEGQ